MTEPSYNIHFKDKIDYVKLSPYEWSQNLLCIATDKKIKVGVLKFQEEFDELEQEMEFEQLDEFSHPSRVHAICWSPSASLSKLPKTIELCVAGSDFNMTFLLTDFSNNSRLNKTLIGHTNYVNDCAFDYESEYLASVSDDFTCKLWSNVHFQLLHTFNLTSVGVGVCWHREESSRLLVGEKSGVIRLYCIRTFQALSSYTCQGMPLTSISWSAQSKLVAALTAGEIVIVDITLTNQVVDSKVVHVGGGYVVAFCLANENYVATVGKPNNNLKIFHIRNKHPLVSTNLSVFGSISWHFRLPYLCVSNNNKLSFFKILPK